MTKECCTSWVGSSASRFAAPCSIRSCSASLDELTRRSEELRLSRARVVAASDAERRRIERDLHDGAQQHLISLAVHIGLARDLADADPVEAKAALAQAAAETQEALDRLRDLAHGIYPQLLLERGLGDALRAVVDRPPLHARIETIVPDRYPPEVEATVYFCCLEGLQNAAKHAGDGARVAVRVWEEEGGLLFELADDGLGFDPSARTPGGGLTNMRDRLGAIGGTLTVDTEPGIGTTVTGAIPLESGVLIGEVDEHRLHPSVDALLPGETELGEDRVDHFLDGALGQDE